MSVYYFWFYFNSKRHGDEVEKHCEDSHLVFMWVGVCLQGYMTGLSMIDTSICGKKLVLSQQHAQEATIDESTPSNLVWIADLKKQYEDANLQFRAFEQNDMITKEFREDRVNVVYDAKNENEIVAVYEG